MTGLGKAPAAPALALAALDRARFTTVEVALKDVCLSVTDGDHQAPPKAETGIPFITISAMNNGQIDLSKATRFVPPNYFEELKPERQPSLGDILYSVTGSIGIAAPVLSADPFVFQRHIAIIRPDPSQVQPEYLRYILQSPQIYTQAEACATGTAQLTIPLRGLRDLIVPLPPLPEQRRIVRKLDTLSARSTTARTHLTAIEKLVERYKRAVAQQLIHAQEWETVPFLDACDAYQPRTISKSELVPDGAYPVYGANGVIGRYDQYNHEDPQLLITCRGATCGTVNVSQPFSWITGNAMVVDGTKSGLSLAFLREYFAKGFDFTTVISGSAQPQITRQSLAQLRMPVVDENQQREIVRRIETAFAKIDRLAAEAEKALKLLGHLDQRILAKAFAGDLVPQDPNDEPAETLLARIRDARATAPKARRGRK